MPVRNSMSYFERRAERTALGSLSQDPPRMTRWSQNPAGPIVALGFGPGLTLEGAILAA